MGKSFIIRMFIKEKLITNCKNNFAIIVPSKALINETSSNLINELQTLLVEKDYRIVTSAGATALEQNHNYIFVLTPERLLYTLIKYESLLLDYVFIDEAHKISEKDARSAFYYKVVDMLLQRQNNPKIFFASPNIPNPQVFLKLLSNGNKFAIKSEYSPVSQIKYLLDYSTNTHYVYNDKSSKFIQINNTFSFEGLLKEQFDNNLSTIVYVNSKDVAIKMAERFASKVDFEPDDELKEFSKEIAISIHEDFYLAELILKGVAFHIGYLPSNIRLKLEGLYKARKIKIMFCTSTLVEGVNLPADNLFITTYKRGRNNLSPVDFRNLIGRVGRIEYNLYGHVFLTKLCNEEKVSIKKYEEFLQQPVPEQNLSIVTELSFEDKNLIVSNLINGIIEIPKGNIKKEKYKLIRKFELILLKDIMTNRQSFVKSHFADVLSKEDEQKIKRIFEKNEAKQDDDINISIDQTTLLVAKIKGGLRYPNIGFNGNANYYDVLNFLQTLRSIFKWDKYEDELSKPNVIKWYATLLCQWIEGKGLQHLTNSAVRNAKERMYSSNPKKLRINRETLSYDNSSFHENMVIGETLYAIENIILFSFSNYFLKFSECYKKVYNLQEIQNDWYEYVEYGTTNILTITLQKYGFSRETALYIRQNKSEYVKNIEGSIKLKKDLIKNSKETIKKEIQEVMYNAPELFID